jgi:predicted metal-dependent hydrolase
MVSRLERSERRKQLTDDDLMRRATRLSDRHLGGMAVPESVRWVDNQSSRWGSCTPGDRTIRLSTRLQGMPVWVVDYVLVHELAHLLEPGHDEKFWSWVDRYPQAEKAKGYLLGWSAAARLDPPPGEDVD